MHGLQHSNTLLQQCASSGWASRCLVLLLVSGNALQGHNSGKSPVPMSTHRKQTPGCTYVFIATQVDLTPNLLDPDVGLPPATCIGGIAGDRLS